MKRKFSFLTLASTALFVLGMIVISSCTKEGPAGKDGKDGSDGAPGADGTASCIVCHSDNQVLFAKELQTAASFHATGGAFNRNTGECAVCHTSQGFRGNLDGSFDYTAAGAIINNPVPPNCYTCHKIHDTFEATDIALTVTGPVELRNTNGATHNFGKGSLCASCHQGRTVSPWPTIGGPDITVTNTRFSVHHGPQGNTIAGVGKGLFEVGTGLVNSAHSTQIAESCVTCHMADGSGVASGGHTFWMGETLNTKGCTGAGCHDSAEDIAGMTEEFQTEISTLLTDLKLKLDAAGITRPGSDNSVAGTYSPLVAGACISYRALVEDKSLGVHNPKYIKKLLENLIAAL